MFAQPLALFQRLIIRHVRYESKLTDLPPIPSSIAKTVKTILMEKISNIKFGPLPPESPYVKPIRFYYQQNGKEKNWDMLKIHDSVGIIIHNTTRKSLVVVRQFRPAVYYNSIPDTERVGEIDTNKYPAELGITLELCAGICDKDAAWERIAKEEVLEECGYDVQPENLREIVRFRSGVGASGAVMALYYCEVTDADKVGPGGGVGEEIIEVVELTIPQIKAILNEAKFVNSPGAFMFGLQWFLYNFESKLN